jgi:hypothetical protein
VSIPNWYEFLLLGLAAWRTYQFIGQDTIIDRPRRYITSKSEHVETMIECPYCSGFWIALVWWGAFQLWEHGSVVVAAAIALTALVPIIEHLSSED